MATKLQSYPRTDVPRNREGRYFGMAVMPATKSLSSTTTTIDSFIGEDSWFFFNVLKLDTTFLTKPAPFWKSMDSYSKSKTIVGNVKVVNDTAQRGVKIASDLIDFARKEKKYQSIMQVVELNRQQQPNQRRKKAKKSKHKKRFLYT